MQHRRRASRHQLRRGSAVAGPESCVRVLLPADRQRPPVREHGKAGGGGGAAAQAAQRPPSRFNSAPHTGRAALGSNAAANADAGAGAREAIEACAVFGAGLHAGVVLGRRDRRITLLA